MDDRQRHALLHPIQDEIDAARRMPELRTIRLRGDGSLLVVILAVDR